MEYMCWCIVYKYVIIPRGQNPIDYMSYMYMRVYPHKVTVREQPKGNTLPKNTNISISELVDRYVAHEYTCRPMYRGLYMYPVHTQTHTHTHSLTYTNTLTDTHILTHSLTYTHSHTHTHTHTHTNKSSGKARLLHASNVAMVQ